MKDICKRAFLNAEPRLVEGVYLVSMHATPDAYGKIYGVINKCRGRVVKEEVQEGTNNFLIDALIPVIESFVFNEEIRSKSCGIAYPQLVFDGFEILDDDPFFIPMTEEELEDHGQGDILPPNPAKIIIEKVRTRKGLPIDKKIVVAAEQQRTLSKKK
jgi:ribosome assembly protein 1